MYLVMSQIPIAISFGYCCNVKIMLTKADGKTDIWDRAFLLNKFKYTAVSFLILAL